MEIAKPSESPIPESPKLIKCPHCGHVWFTRSKLGYITCPNCRRKFPNPFYQSKEKT